MSPETVPLIQVRGVSFRYPRAEETPVLSDVDLDIGSGEVIVLTGPSGSGKTTLLTLIGALRSLQAGDIAFAGRSLMGLDSTEMEAVRRGIGFVFQHHALFAALSAEQTVRVSMSMVDGGYSKTELRERPRQLLSDLGLGHVLHHKPGELSEGQKQRVAIARALVNSPRAVLADEPTAALDRHTADAIIERLRSHARNQQAAVVIVSHDPRVFAAGDRLVRLVDGRITDDSPASATPD